MVRVIALRSPLEDVTAEFEVLAKAPDALEPLPAARLRHDGLADLPQGGRVGVPDADSGEDTAGLEVHVVEMEERILQRVTTPEMSQ